MTGRQAYQSELHRLRGELLLAREGPVAEHEALNCFQRAMEIGRQQGALAWELRTAMSIVRHRQRRDQVGGEELADARAVLRDIYARFTEGFAFPDLREAATLLDTASPHAPAPA